MNIYFIIILAALLLGYILELLADLFQPEGAKTRAARKELKDLYDPSEYARSQNYTIVTTKFDIIRNTFSLAATLIFWFAGGFRMLDDFAVSLGFGTIITGHTGLLAATGSAIMFPFSIYSTFVIEEKFGFNKTSAGTFILDTIKGILLAVLIGAPLLAGILAFLQYSGEHSWLWCWMAVTVFMVFIQFVAPTWIMPLFNKFTPS